ncbi:MAG: putative oxidoreductase, short-chain dehydrogenase/reductase family [Microbacteriaceae bacterium]|jgi:NAD(P)-dependent dehydrogenase (short-subunit alcohol dehydrogenase family)|nr:putative oxidoreductase, short-chain dehydrogenase/reductase family [Microbacteriaceae bacterium]HEV7956712.1 oxidoreductase [Marisediminicola sp.]
MPETNWTTSDLPDLAGKTAIVTGSNSGIGLGAARALAAHGAHVVLAVRDVAKGTDAAASIDGSSEVRRLDLADLASVREFADGWSGDVHLLINNAGLMAPPLTRTRDGFEIQFGTNHLGHFALTNLLLRSVTSRVVTVSSLAHRAGRIDFDDPNWRSRPYRRLPAYGQSKLANLLFTLELQRRLTAEGSSVLATSAHPGWTATNLQSRSDNRVTDALSRWGNRLFAQDAASGALPTLYAATADLPGGSFAGPGGIGQTRGAPILVGPSNAALDVEVAKRLWTLSERLTGVSYPG